MRVDEPTQTVRRAPTGVIVAIVLAWAAALAARAGGHADLLDHDKLLGAGGASLASFGVFLAAWIVMVAAMMLPSAVPLARLFRASSAHQPRPGLALAVFTSGYVVLWTAFGWAALSFDATVHRWVDALPWLSAHSTLVLASVLAAAGLFQFSALKDRCLQACRHPAAYLIAHYRRGVPAAFRLGWSHGLFCLGCCWALMLVAFASGMTDLRLMAGFTALMAYEKIGRHGVEVAQLAGVALIFLATVVAIGSFR
jgi:predicted metal-binding membrane protein